MLKRIDSEAVTGGLSKLRYKSTKIYNIFRVYSPVECYAYLSSSEYVFDCSACMTSMLLDETEI